MYNSTIYCYNLVLGVLLKVVLIALSYLKILYINFQHHLDIHKKDERHLE